MGTGATSHVVAAIDACSERTPHEPHLRQPMWPRQDEKPHDPRWLWCLGGYVQERQNRRVVIATTDGVETLVGEGLTFVGSAHRVPREPGECEECREPEDFDWDLLVIVNDGPCLVCHVHGLLAPGWAYEVEIGLEAWQNPEVLPTPPDHWAACSEREHGHIGAVRHLIRRGALTTACGATATHPEVWRGNAVKPRCEQCVTAYTR